MLRCRRAQPLVLGAEAGETAVGRLGVAEREIHPLARMARRRGGAIDPCRGGQAEPAEHEITRGTPEVVIAGETAKGDVELLPAGGRDAQPVQREEIARRSGAGSKGETGGGEG
ncbi:hypothetical protein SDC9_26042 [bioreactor metagenome]|uniref:Uncharacterized protein n=1 Tax=bioreactor metagenome TaxID=1076179 RepID=A0A644UM68_9ZZZZ